MNFCLVSVTVLSAVAMCLGLMRNRRKPAEAVFLVALTSGCAAAFVNAVQILTSQQTAACRLPWQLPYGEVSLGIDSLSAWFLLAITALCFLAGIFGTAYLKNADHSRDLSGHFSLYLAFTASMVLVVTARNAVLFLMVWEAMSLSSYFLITHDDDKEEVRKAGLLYLVATHAGTLCLWVMFILLGTQASSMDFDRMAAAHFPLGLAGGIFVLGIIGFGTKAGFIPFHIWLPHAHPAAPSHVSAVLSGVMIKMGIYGLLRLIFTVKQFPDWCPALLLLIGITSGLGGVLYALGQHELKRLLAYHSIENIGIIALGLGMGLWGQLHHHPAVALIGYAGGLLHVFNHALFKGLLFLSAGSVIEKTHTGHIDHLGGLIKFLPWTAGLFLVGSLAICGLPVFNGFISEWLVFRSLFEGVLSSPLGAAILVAAGILALALIGGLAVMCFTKAFGAVFLGQSRTLPKLHLRESPPAMIAPMAILALICLWIGILPQTMVTFCMQAVQQNLPERSALDAAQLTAPLPWIVLGLALFAVISAMLMFLRRVSTGVEGQAPTWGCGYLSANSRMQHTASSFAVPILQLFREFLCLRVTGPIPKQVFPRRATLSTHVIDASEDYLFRRLFRALQRLSVRLKMIQCGYAQMYVLYIFVFLFFILIWKVT